MVWLTLAVISSIFLGLYDVARKHALRENAVLPVLFFATFFGSCFFLGVIGLNAARPALAIELGLRLAPLDSLAHARILLKAVIVSASWICAFVALKHLPLSIVAPIRSSSPVWTLVGAMILFGERLSWLQFLGVAVVFAGYWFLATAGRREEIFFTRNRWILFSVIATLLGSSSALYDKYLIQLYEPFVVQSWFYFYLIAVLGAVVGLVWYPRRHVLTRFRWSPSIPVIGLLLAAADYVYFNALAQPGAMISLISIVRRSSVVVAFVIGAAVFKENNKRRKAFAVIWILLGVALIALAKS